MHDMSRAGTFYVGRVSGVNGDVLGCQTMQNDVLTMTRRVQTMFRQCQSDVSVNVPKCSITSSVFIRKVCRRPCPKPRKSIPIPFLSMCVRCCIDDIMAHIRVLCGYISDHCDAHVGLVEQFATPSSTPAPGRIRRRQQPYKARVYGTKRCIGGLPPRRVWS